MNKIDCMYGITKGLKLVKVRKIPQNNIFVIKFPQGNIEIIKHFKLNELSGHLDYISISYDKALRMQKKLRKQKEKHLFDDNFEAFTSFIDTKKYKDGFDDGYMEGRADAEKEYEKAYKKVCKQLAEKTIAPKEYWEKWGMEDE